MPSTQASKRQRTNDTITHISDLPIGIIVDVSTHLSKPSKAIMAIAFTAPSSSWQCDNLTNRPSPISKAIISSSEWETFDFEDIEKSLANRLSDDDMSAVLQCINAQDVLKKLKLTGCTNITGRGLSPLRGSVVLEQIDLSLIKKTEDIDNYIYGSSVIDHSMSKDVVLSILDSIISSIGCSLKYILLPCNWRTDDQLQQFANRYNQHLNGVNCSKCTKSIRSNQRIQWYNLIDKYHYNTCYSCLKHYCRDCSTSVTNHKGSLNCCTSCRKEYCLDCDSGMPEYNTCIDCLKEKRRQRVLSCPRTYH